MSSKKITYSNDFKVKVLDYYFKHGGDDKFGLKKKTAGHFNIDKKTINRMLNNPEMVKRARKLISSRKSAASSKPPTASRPPVKPAVRKAGSTPSKVNSSSSRSASSSQSSASSSSSNKASTSSTTSTKSVSSSSKQVNSTNSGSNRTPQKSKPGIPEDSGSPGVEVFELPEDPDYSLLKRSINAATNGVGGLAKLLVTGTEEVRNVVLNECDVILECKVCRGLFRSVVNFLAHKRIYCQDEFADVRTLFHKGDIQGLTSQSGTVVVEPEPPPDGEEFNTMRTMIPTTYSSIRSSQGKAKRSGIDSIALKLARKRKAYHASSTSSSISTGSSSYYKSLNEVTRCRDKLSRDCSVVLEDIGGVTNAVFQSFVPPGCSSPSTSMSSLVDEASHSKSGVTVAINQNGEIVKTASGEIVSMEVDQPSDSSDSKDLTCLLCNTRFATQKTLSVHQRSHHGFERCIYSCPICQASFLSMWAVVKHLQRTHKKTKSQIERLRKVVKKNIRKKIIYQKTEKDKDHPVSMKDGDEEEEDEEDEVVEEEEEEKVEESGSSSVKSSEITSPKKSGGCSSLPVSPVKLSPVKGSSHKGWRSKDGVRWMCNVCRKMFITRVASLAHVATHIVCNFEPKAVLVNIQNEQALADSKDASTSEDMQDKVDSEAEESENSDVDLCKTTDEEQESEDSEDDESSSVIESEKCKKTIAKETVSKLKKKYMKIAVSSAKSNEEVDLRESIRKRIVRGDSNSSVSPLKSGKILVKEVSNNIKNSNANQIMTDHSKTLQNLKDRGNQKKTESQECGKKTVLVKSTAKSAGNSSGGDIVCSKGTGTTKENRLVKDDRAIVAKGENIKGIPDKKRGTVDSKSCQDKNKKMEECAALLSKDRLENRKLGIVNQKLVVLSKSIVKKELSSPIVPGNDKNAFEGRKHESETPSSISETDKDFKVDSDNNTRLENSGSSLTQTRSDDISDKDANSDLTDTIKSENNDGMGLDARAMCATKKEETKKGYESDFEVKEEMDIKEETETCQDDKSQNVIHTSNIKNVGNEEVKKDCGSDLEVGKEMETSDDKREQNVTHNVSSSEVSEDTFSNNQKKHLKPKDEAAALSASQMLLKGTIISKSNVAHAPFVSVNIPKSSVTTSSSVSSTPPKGYVTSSPSGSSNLPKNNVTSAPSASFNLSKSNVTPSSSMSSNLLKIDKTSPPMSSNLPKSNVTLAPSASSNLPKSTVISAPSASSNLPKSNVTLAPSASSNLPKSNLTPSPSASSNLPKSSVTSAPSASSNLPKSSVMSAPSASSNLPKSNVTLAPSASSNHPKSNVTPSPSANSNLPMSNVTSAPSGSFNLPKSNVSSAPSANSNLPKSNVTPSPSASSNLPKSNVTSSPSTSSNLKSNVTHAPSASYNFPKSNVTSASSVSYTSKKLEEVINPSVTEATAKSEISKVFPSKPDISSDCGKLAGGAPCKPVYTVASSSTSIHTSDSVLLSKSEKERYDKSPKYKENKSGDVDSNSPKSSGAKSPGSILGKKSECFAKQKTLSKYASDSGTSEVQRTVARHPVLGDALTLGKATSDSSLSQGNSNFKPKISSKMPEIEKSKETPIAPKSSVSQTVSQLSASAAMLKSFASFSDSKANPRSTAVPKASSTYAAQLKKYADSPSENSSVGGLSAKIPNAEMKVKKDSRSPVVLALRKDGKVLTGTVFTLPRKPGDTPSTSKSVTQSSSGSVLTLPRKPGESPSTSKCVTQSSGAKSEMVDPLVVAYRMTGPTIPVVSPKIAQSTSAVKVKKFMNSVTDSAKSEPTDGCKGKLDHHSGESSRTSAKTSSETFGTSHLVHGSSDDRSKPVIAQLGLAKLPVDGTEIKHLEDYPSQLKVIHPGSYKTGEKSSGESSKSHSGKAQSQGDKFKPFEQASPSSLAHKSIERQSNISNLSACTTVSATLESEITSTKALASGSIFSSSKRGSESGTTVPLTVKPIPSSNMAQEKKCDEVNLKSELTVISGSANVTATFGQLSKHPASECSESQHILEQKSPSSPPVIPGLIPSYKMKLQRSNEVGAFSVNVKETCADSENSGNESDNIKLPLSYKESKLSQGADYPKSGLQERNELFVEKVAGVTNSSKSIEKVENKKTDFSGGKSDSANPVSSCQVKLYGESTDCKSDYNVSKRGFECKGKGEKVEGKQLYYKMKKVSAEYSENLSSSSPSYNTKTQLIPEIGKEKQGYLASSYVSKSASCSNLKVNTSTKKEENKKVWKMVVQAQTSLKSHNPVKDIEENFGFLEDETSYSSPVECGLESTENSSVTYSQKKRKLDTVDCPFQKKKKMCTESSDASLLPQERKTTFQSSEIRNLSSSDTSDEKRDSDCERFSPSPSLETTSSYDLLKHINIPKITPSELGPFTTYADSTIDEAAVLQSHTTFGDLSYDYDVNE